MYAIIKVSQRTQVINQILGYAESLTEAKNVSDDLNSCLSGINAKVYFVTYQKISPLA